MYYVQICTHAILGKNRHWLLADKRMEKLINSADLKYITNKCLARMNDIHCLVLSEEFLELEQQELDLQEHCIICSSYLVYGYFRSIY